MSFTDRARSAGRHLDVFAVVEKLLTLASLVLVAITVGGQLGEMIGVHGKVGLVIAWSIAIVYDALWIGSLRMSEVAIRQRSTVGMIVMLGLSAVAVGVSATILLMLGHAKVFAFVPVAAALFMGLRLFAGNVLADPAMAARIAEQSAADRNARALAAANARHLRSEATTDVLAETAGHLAEVQRQTARADVLTRAQAEINEARAKAEGRLQESEKKHGAGALAFAGRDLALTVSRPAVTPGRVTGVTQARAEIETVTPLSVTADETDSRGDVAQEPATGAMALDELAAIDGVDLPEPGVTLSDEQLEVVLRWLRYGMEPPRSYRQAQKDFRRHGFIGGEHRVRRIWGEIETREAVVPTR
ncbi:hypothetical protein ABT150_23295 [Streptomyces mirabilis]|uniref:hypothetical protein n=1 Tax=Streptomyces mirabilis TaxID=68239 RepID=UPI00332039D1